jgi:gas vesicle protein
MSGTNPGSHINANPKGLLELQRSILNHKDEIARTAEGLLKDIKLRRDKWSDSEFEMMLDELRKYRRRLAKTEEEMGDMAKRVEKYAMALERSRREFAG